MNRTDRLHAIHEELRRRGTRGTSAARLAEQFEVSTRTIKRDISALQRIGSPIWAQPGPGGGYMMAASASLPPVNFTASQAVAVAVALAAQPPGIPFAVDAVAALNKLNDALAAAERTKAHAIASRIWVQPPPTAEIAARPPVLRSVEHAMLEQVALAIDYEPPDRPKTRRVIEPTILAWANDTWYLVAHCRLRNDIRWFRLDRITRADTTRHGYQPRPATEIGTPPPRAQPIHHPETQD